MTFDVTAKLANFPLLVSSTYNMETTIIKQMEKVSPCTAYFLNKCSQMFDWSNE
jgi:hypothetical protein